LLECSIGFSEAGAKGGSTDLMLSSIMEAGSYFFSLAGDENLAVGDLT
jgi:hypothetical protein